LNIVSQVQSGSECVSFLADAARSHLLSHLVLPACTIHYSRFVVASVPYILTSRLILAEQSDQHQSIRQLLYCCSCGYCGGEGCHARPGGEVNCCGRVIAAANVLCSGSRPPCVLKTKPTDGVQTCAGGTGIWNSDNTVCCSSE
jgi:hypothetical protein